MVYMKIKGHTGYVKDMFNGVVLNVNDKEIEAAKKRKAEKLKQKQELNDLKNEVSDIKLMLTKIVEKLNG